MLTSHLGIDIGGTQTKWAVVTDDYRIVERGWVPTSYSSTTEELDVLECIMRPWLGQVAGVGFSVPGSVPANDGAGTIRGGGALTFNDGFALGSAVHNLTGLPVCVENDGKACALGEYVSGALTGCSVGMVMVIGTGIGGGIVVDGHVFRGAHAFAGELSFMGLLDPAVPAPRGMFGQTGGWRSLRGLVLEEMGLIDSLGTPRDEGFDPEKVDGRQVFEWVNSGDAGAIAGLERYATIICSHIFDVQAVLDPEVVAIGGGISAQPMLTATLQRRMVEMLTPFSTFRPAMPRIVRTVHGNDANLLGAVYECRQGELAE